jgi:hypothetical protein
MTSLPEQEYLSEKSKKAFMRKYREAMANTKVNMVLGLCFGLT